MFDLVCGMFCFVTASVSFLYGTRICWACGKKCGFDLAPAERRTILKTHLPGGFIVYLFGFLILFSNLLNGQLMIIILSLISALILSQFVVSMAMPALKRKPFNRTH